jgi:hypothetical protein
LKKMINLIKLLMKVLNTKNKPVTLNLKLITL